MNCSTVDIPFLSETLSGERVLVILKVANLNNEEGLVIATRGEGEKVNLMICLARELNPGLQRERREH